MRCKVYKFIFHIQPIVSPIIIVKDLISNYGSMSQAGLKKKFSALLAPVWSKNKRGAPPGPLPWIRHCIGMLLPVSCDKWKPPQDWHIMLLVLKVPALETVGWLYSSFLPKGKKTDRDTDTSNFLYPSYYPFCGNLCNPSCHIFILQKQSIPFRHPPPPPNLVYNASKFSFLSLQAQMVSKVSWSIIARITKSLSFYIGDGVGKGWGTGHYFFAHVGSGDNRRFVGKSSSYVWGKLPSRLQNYSKCILYVNFHYVFQELVKQYSWYVIHAGNHMKRRYLKFVLV